MTRSFTAALCAAGALLMAAPAAHAAGWVTSGPLSPADKVAIAPRLTVTPSGTRVIAWVQDQDNGVVSENVSIRVAPPGQDFGPTQTIDGAGVSDFNIATAGDGTVALAWADQATRSLHVARMAPGQDTFTEATPFVPPGSETPLAAEIAFSGSTLFAATISQDTEGREPASVFVTTLAAGANALTVDPGAFPGGAIDHVDNPTGQPQVFLGSLHLAADPAGAVVMWHRSGETADGQHAITTVDYALPEGAAFSAPFMLDSQTVDGFGTPQMRSTVAAGGGHHYVLWTRDRDPEIFYQDLADPVTKTIDSGGEGSVEDVRAAADGAGALRVVWATEPPNQDNASLFSTVVSPGGNAGLPTPVTPIGIDRAIGDLAVASDGSALVLPMRDDTGFDTTQVEAALASPGGGFGPVEDVSGLQDDIRNAVLEHPPAAFVAPGGRALALWSAADHTGSVNLRVFLSERDTTPPTLSNINVPASATAGQRVTLSAAAADDLSSPTVTWDFGDGSQTQGATVNHVFGSAGAVTVTVTATDSVGNTTSQTRVIAITPAGVVPPAEDRTPPVITGLSAASPRFHVARRATVVVAAARRRHSVKRSPAGTVLRMRLSERATLVLTFTRRGRHQPSGTLVRLSAGPGATAIPFSGRIGRSALAGGTYVLTVTAIDGSGNRSLPARINLTVVRG